MVVFGFVEFFWWCCFWILFERTFLSLFFWMFVFSFWRLGGCNDRFVCVTWASPRVDWLFRRDQDFPLGVPPSFLLLPVTVSGFGEVGALEFA